MTKIAETLADELAAAAIEHIRKTGDEDVVALITKTIGDSSQTLQEAFITSVRVQRAAIRAHEVLEQRKAAIAKQAEPAPEPAPAPASPAPKPDAKGPWDLDGA